MGYVGVAGLEKRERAKDSRSAPEDKVAASYGRKPLALPGLKGAYISERKKGAVLNMRIPAELRERVKVRARASGLSLACYVRLVLEEAVTSTGEGRRRNG